MEDTKIRDARSNIMVKGKKTRRLWIFVLVIVCIATSSYVVYDLISDGYNRSMNRAYQQGTQDVLMTVIQRTNNCSAFEIQHLNNTRAIVDVRCVEQYYQQGVVDVISTIMSQAQNCSVVPLYSGNVTVNLVDVDCTKI